MKSIKTSVAFLFFTAAVGLSTPPAAHAAGVVASGQDDVARNINSARSCKKNDNHGAPPDRTTNLSETGE